MARAIAILPRMLRFAHLDVKYRVHNLSGEGLVYLAIHDVGRGHEVLEGILGDIVLVGKDAP